MDTQTWEFLSQLPSELSSDNLPLQIVTVTKSGVVQALNTGLRVVNGDLVSITDDDAAPHPDWLEKITAHFAKDSSIGAVGGRDWVHRGDKAWDIVTGKQIGRAHV